MLQSSLLSGARQLLILMVYLVERHNLRSLVVKIPAPKYNYCNSFTPLLFLIRKQASGQRSSCLVGRPMFKNIMPITYPSCQEIVPGKTILRHPNTVPIGRQNKLQRNIGLAILLACPPARTALSFLPDTS